jgi:hypothetical protein
MKAASRAELDDRLARESENILLTVAPERLLRQPPARAAGAVLVALLASLAEPPTKNLAVRNVTTTAVAPNRGPLRAGQQSCRKRAALRLMIDRVDGEGPGQPSPKFTASRARQASRSSADLFHFSQEMKNGLLGGIPVANRRNLS